MQCQTSDTRKFKKIINNKGESANPYPKFVDNPETWHGAYNPNPEKLYVKDTSKGLKILGNYERETEELFRLRIGHCTNRILLGQCNPQP
jgi:hypothetical protein